MGGCDVSRRGTINLLGVTGRGRSASRSINIEVSVNEPSSDHGNRSRTTSFGGGINGYDKASNSGRLLLSNSTLAVMAKGNNNGVHSGHRRSRDDAVSMDDDDATSVSRCRSYSDVNLRCVQQQQQHPPRPHPLTRRQTAQNMPKKQEVNLALTLVSISLLFIVCQSVKLIADVYELVCEKVRI